MRRLERPRAFSFPNLRAGPAQGGQGDGRLRHGASTSRSEGDEDDDDEPDESKSEGSDPEGDADNDTDNDYEDNLHKSFYDRDDSAIVGFGRAASASEERVLAAVVKRYTEAAAVADGATACALIASNIAVTAAEDYGRNAGPS